MHRSLALALSLGFALATPVAAQQSGGGTQAAAAGSSTAAPPSIGPACQDPANRQFDFWIGEWKVTNPDGQEVGRNTISRVADGCGLLEQWRAAGGGTGNSLNTYDPTTDQWNQFWVGGGGTRLHITGGLEDGAMRMSGRRTTPQGEVIDRITWTPMADGSVEQVWDQSFDGGQTWKTGFRGLYERVAAGGS